MKSSAKLQQLSEMVKYFYEKYSKIFILENFWGIVKMLNYWNLDEYHFKMENFGNVLAFKICNSMHVNV